jgi:hypothetical protein
MDVARLVLAARLRHCATLKLRDMKSIDLSQPMTRLPAQTKVEDVQKRIQKSA